MFDRTHVLLTWGGTLPGDEEWSCGIRLASAWNIEEPVLDFDPSDADLADLMASYSPAVKAYHAALITGLGAHAKLTHIKLAAINRDGHYLPDRESMVEEHFAPIGGGASGPQYPNQVCLVVTTTTDQARGYAKMGRYFLPGPSIILGADGAISVSLAAAAAESAKTFIEAISDSPGIDTPISPGAVVMSKVGSGRTHRINGVKVGRVLDTQRRRRRSLPEGYQATTVDQGTF